MRGKLRFATALAVACAWLVAAPLTAAPKSVTEKILDVLLKGGQIDEAQHTALLEEARAEEERQRVIATDVAAGAPDPMGFSVKWKPGLWFERNDGAVKIQLGGRIQYDFAAFGDGDDFSDRFGDFDTGTEVRRARIFLSGTVYERVIFKAQYDFADGDVDFNDMWVGMTGLPVVGTGRAGHQKEQFSLEALTSSKYVTFMERSLANVFSPGRNTGVAFNNTALDERMTWAAGAFRVTDSFGEATANEDGDWDIGARVTGLPVYQDEGRRLVHLGLSYSHQFIDDENRLRYRQRPEAHLGPLIYDTGEIKADDVDLVAAEFAAVLGPLSFQGEYTHSFVDSSDEGDLDFWGGYVEASYFLTGEHRAYSTQRGWFKRTAPAENFNPDTGDWGAWQVALRFSYLHLNDGDVRGGIGNNIAAALNWYPYRNVRVMTNYIHTQLNGVGNDHILQMRLQIDF